MEHKIKKALRITTDTLNDEIKDNIGAAKEDLRRVGVDPDTGGKLIQKAVELYCKWQFDFCGKGEAFAESYRELRDSIKLSGQGGGAGNE